jgi:hypothetical protein
LYFIFLGCQHYSLYEHLLGLLRTCFGGYSLQPACRQRQVFFCPIRTKKRISTPIPHSVPYIYVVSPSSFYLLAASIVFCTWHLINFSFTCNAKAWSLTSQPCELVYQKLILIVVQKSEIIYFFFTCSWSAGQAKPWQHWG